MVNRFLNSTFALCCRSFEESDGNRLPTKKIKEAVIYKPKAPESKHEQSLWFWKKLPWRDRSAHAIRLVGSDLRRRLRSVSSCLENSEPLVTEADEGRDHEIHPGIKCDCSTSQGDANNDVGVKPEDLNYFYGPEVSQDDVRALLCGRPKGAYLLRPSERVPGNYTLYVVCPDPNTPNSHIKRFPIVAEGSKLCMGTQLMIEFNTIDEIVTRYRSRDIAQGCCLTMPILKRGAAGCVPDEEDIYDSVRRAQKPLSGGAGNGASETILEGYLNKLNKKWKRMYFTLKRSDLLYFEGHKSGQQPPQKIKPKGIIDLTRSDLYPVDPSLHGRSNCFQLVVVNQHQSSQVHVLHCDSEDTADTWRSHLRLYCCNTREAAALEHDRQNPRCVRDLCVTICNASNLSSSKPYFAMIQLNNVQVARTNPQDGKDPSWDEEFSLCDLAANIAHLVVSVYPKGNRRRENDFEIRKQLTLEELDSNHIVSVEQEGRKFRFRIHFSKLTILPRSRFRPFEFALTKDPKVYGPLARFAEAKLDENQRKTLAQSLLYIFLRNDRQAELLLGIGNAVVDAGNKDGLQFRQNTLLSALLFCYMQLTATNWMHSCLDRVTNEILKLGKLEIDTDPSHCPMCSAIQCHPVPLHQSSSSSHSAMLPSGGGLSALGASSSMSGCLCDKNSAKLNELLTIAVDDICHHCNEFPRTLRHVLSQLHLRVVKKWYPPPNPTEDAAASDPPHDPLVDSSDSHPQPHPCHPPHQHSPSDHKLHVVAASFIFLRFLCRALYQPYSMSLIKEQPCEVTQRTMKSLGGLIQNLGNGVQPKNQKYAVMQPYLEDLQPRITGFISKLMTSPDDEAPPPSAMEMKHKNSISLSRELSQVLRLLSRHLDALREVTELENLVAAVEAVLATDTSLTPRR